MTGYMEPDRGDGSGAQWSGGSPGSGDWSGGGPSLSDAGAIDDLFKSDVMTALWRNGINVSKIPPDQIDSLMAKLWQNSYLQGLFSQVGGAVDPSSASITEQNLTSEIEKTLFNPTQSSDLSLVSLGMGLRQASGLPLTSAEQTYLGNAGATVPAPFDPKFFSQRTEYFHETPGEMGNDYGMPVGTQLYSPVTGTIKTEDGGKRNWGKRVFVVMANGWKFAIGHMSQFNVTDGQQVNPGMLLGLSGGAVGDPSSGQSTGPHIEAQFIDPSGSYVDPYPILQSIFSGGTYAQMPFGMAGAGTVSAADAQDRLLGRDPLLEARYPDVVSTWSKYFGSHPTGQQIQSVVGGAMSTAAGGVGGGSGQQLSGLLRQAGFPEQVIPTMVAIGMAESGGRADAVGDKAIGGSIGIWQIYTKAHPNLVQKYNLADPLQNAKAAKEVFDSQGLGAWSTYKNGAFKSFLGQTGATVTGGGLDATQIEDRIRGLPSHVPGIGIGQFTDLRSSLNSQANKLFGHDVTDGMIKEAYDGGYTSTAGVDFYLRQMDLGGKIPAHVYSSIVSAAQPHMQGLYNQSGFDPRIASQLVQTHSEPGTWMGPPTPQHYMEPDRGDN